MPVRVQGIFEKYEFSDEEVAQAKTFTSYQLMHIQTELAISMQLKLALEASPDKSPEAFTREHEYYRGRIEILQYIIEVHDTTNAMETIRASQHATKQSTLFQQDGGGYSSTDLPS